MKARVITSTRYARNGECLEEPPTVVDGEPLCGNGFVECGDDPENCVEQCDCGLADCSGVDHCCNGTSCLFVEADYECSDNLGLKSCPSSKSLIPRDRVKAKDCIEACVKTRSLTGLSQPKRVEYAALNGMGVICKRFAPVVLGHVHLTSSCTLAQSAQQR
eukprot:3959565-Amphidinium_carterae.1